MSRLKRSSQVSGVRDQGATRPFLWAEIDLDNLRGNYRILKAIAKRSKADVLAVVKADAYGHGMDAVARALFKEGVRFFGVATLEEGLRLREVCPPAKILVLGSFHADQVERYFQSGIRPTLSSPDDLRLLEKGLRGRKRFPAHVKVDTGMGRLGVWHGDALRLFKALGDSKKVILEGVYTHFSNADEEKGLFTKLQMHRFETVVEKLRAMGFHPRYVHAANSLGLARFAYPHLNLVRPGLLLYGLDPGKSVGFPVGLKPVMSVKARITFLKDVGAEQPLSYGRTYHTSKPTRIATVPMGYSHGYRVGLSNKAFVVVRGKRCPVVGRVTMDQTLVDVGQVPGIRRWDTVTLLGHDGKSRVSAEEMAAWLDTIPYEVVCSIHSRIPRVYKGLR